MGWRSTTRFQRLAFRETLTFFTIPRLEYVARRHYNQVEIDEKIIPKGTYDAAALCRFWHEEVERTRSILECFPRAEAGKAVMTKDGKLFKGDAEALKSALAAGELEFHEGTIGGAWPRIIG